MFYLPEIYSENAKQLYMIEYDVAPVPLLARDFRQSTSLEIHLRRNETHQ